MPTPQESQSLWRRLRRVMTDYNKLQLHDEEGSQSSTETTSSVEPLHTALEIEMSRGRGRR